MARLSTKMLIGVMPATTKIAARATSTAAPPTASGTRRGDDRSEHEQQRDRRERQRDELAAAEVGLGHGLDVAVERGAAGELDLEPGRRGASRSRIPGRAAGESSGGSRQEDDVVGGVAVGRDLARAERVRQDPDDVRRLGDVGRSRRPRRSRTPACRPSAVGLWSTTTTADGGVLSSSWRRALARADSRSSRMKPPARSAPHDARRERAARARSTTVQRRDDPPPPADGEPAEPRERIGGSIDRGTPFGGRRHDVGHATKPASEAGFGGFRRHDDPGPRTRHRPRRSRAGEPAAPRAALPEGPRAAIDAWAAHLAEEVARDQPAQHVAVFVPDAVAGGLRLVAQVWGAGEDTGEVVVGEWIVPFAGRSAGGSTGPAPPRSARTWPSTPTIEASPAATAARR